MNEKMKNYMGGAGVFALVIIAISALSYVNTYSKSVEPSSFRSFTVEGQGKVVIVPDVAQFSATILTEGGKDIGKLQSENNTKANAIIAFLKENGVDEKDIKTSGYYVNPRYTYFDCSVSPAIYGMEPGRACPPPEIAGYSISQTIEVKVRNFDKAGDILSGTVSKGANSVSGLNFTIDDPEKAQEEAREEAIEKAKAKAESIARSGGFSVGRLLSISEGGMGMPYRYGKDAYAGAAYDVMNMESAPIQAGSQEVIVTVSLQYEIN